MTNHRPRPSIGPAGSLDWPPYEPGSFLFSRDLMTEQRSRLRQLTRHNSYLHGSGVLCGLWVAPTNASGKPWAIQVCPGYAIGCCGEELEVRAATMVDVRDYLWRRPRNAQNPGYVGIRYIESHRRPVAVASRGCGCEETKYESSRILDAVQIDILWDLPDVAETAQLDLCAQQLLGCPHCSNSPYVFLARINLPRSEGEPISRNHISNGLST